MAVPPLASPPISLDRVRHALFLRKTNVQALKEGWAQVWADDDFCVIDNERVVGCIRAEVILGQPKWRWAINGVP